jgi:hypothetical protein
MTEAPEKQGNFWETSISTAGDGSFVFMPRETLGVIFLGILALLLLIGLQRAHARNRELMAQLLQQANADAPTTDATN